MKHFILIAGIIFSSFAFAKVTKEVGNKKVDMKFKKSEVTRSVASNPAVDMTKFSAKKMEGTYFYADLNDDVSPKALDINTAVRKAMTSECFSESYAEDGFSEMKATPTFLGTSYYSLMISGSEYCGGAHPNNATYFKTYNLKTGMEVKVEKEMDSSKLPAFVKLYNSKITETDCKMDEGMAYFNYGLQSNGIVVVGEYPHAASVCANSINFSLKEIAPFVKKGSWLLKGAL
jgi:hypothetical protein